VCSLWPINGARRLARRDLHPRGGTEILQTRNWLAGVLLATLCPGAFGWSDHAGLLWPLLRTLPTLTETTVPAEPLEDFVRAEAAGLEALLGEHERVARDDLPHYPPLPQALAFRADAADPRAAFLAAIRVNPTLAYGLYRQLTVEDVPPDFPLLQFADLSFLGTSEASSHARYWLLEAGDPVSPAHVLAVGNDEPDFGMDVGLYQDNGTQFGAQYGFGTQPFGNPNLDYSSQAPFHMGFYHLDWLTRTAQPDLLRTLPEWRISLFGALADFAFATGHDYWGWRFAGWALHYVGDLSQPYHAQPLPGIGTAEALWLVIRGRSGEAIQLVSNRHGVLESYQFQRVRAALAAGRWQDPLLAAVAAGGQAPEFTDRTVREALSLESVEAGAALDAALAAHMPARFVSDPAFEWSGSGEESRIVAAVREEGGDAAIVALDGALQEQLRRFSRYARAWIERRSRAAQR
jgi:hypothetical protein